MEHLRARTPEADGAAPVTIADYQEIATEHFSVQLGDWVFKVPPYADPSPEDDAYLDLCRERDIPESALQIAARMRALVPEFLRAAADELLSGKPRVIGFSTVFQQNVACLALAKVIKARDPGVTIVFGGGNCDGPMGAALLESFPWVDVVVRGEGERVFVEVVDDVLAGRPIRPQPGLCYRVEGRAIAVPPNTKPEFSVSEIPTPVYDQYFERLQKGPLRPELWPEVAVLFESSRGCWWGAKSHCTFCGLNAATMMFRSKSPKQVVEEMLYLADRYKILDFVAVDDIIDLRHIRDLLPMIRATGYDFVIFYETKANVNKEQLRAFLSAGVTAIQPGVESLSSPILRLMRKGVTALQNIRLLKWCAEIGVVPAWNLLSGFPGEPPEEYEHMTDLVPSLVHLQPPQFMPVQIQRFSPMFERPEEHGLEITGPMPYYAFLYPVTGELLHNLVYDFEARHLDGRDPATYTGPLGEAVKKWQDASKVGLGSLHYRRGPGFLVVTDRRPGLENADYRFDDVEANVYLGCDAGATPEQIRERLLKSIADAPSVEEIRLFLDGLVDSRLMYREGNLYLSLAIASTGKREADAQSQLDHVEEPKALSATA